MVEPDPIVRLPPDITVSVPLFVSVSFIIITAGVLSATIAFETVLAVRDPENENILPASIITLLAIIELVAEVILPVKAIVPPAAPLSTIVLSMVIIIPVPMVTWSSGVKINLGATPPQVTGLLQLPDFAAIYAAPEARLLQSVPASNTTPIFVEFNRLIFMIIIFRLLVN